MKKEIITFREWYNREPDFSKIYEKSPVLNLLYPDVALTWMSQQSPQLQVSTCIFEEALHKFENRFVFIPYLVDLDNTGQMMRIANDIMYHSISEWNKYEALKAVLNSQMSLATLQDILGNYSLTKTGGWTDTYNSEDYTDKDTYAKETGRSMTISNFQTVDKQISSTTISHDPDDESEQPALEHHHEPNPEYPSKTKRVYDGGGHSTLTNYHEFGQRMGEFYKNYKDLILHFPNTVDLFLSSTAQAYLTDVYDTNMWSHILSDEY